MAKVIHQDHYRLTSDTSSFTKGVSASKRELNDAKRIMRQTQTPLEKYEAKTKKVGELVKKGALSQEQANQALKKYKAELDGATKKQSKFFSVLSKNKGLITGVFSVAAVRKFAAGVNTALTRIDDLAKQSKTLNTGAGSLLRIQSAAGLSSGVGAGQVNTALEKLQKSIGDAKQGRGTGKTRLEQLGLDAEKLSRLQADKQFLAIADAIGKISNKNDQVAITQDLFGRSNAKLVETLRQGSTEILNQTSYLEERAKFLDENSKKAEATNDAFAKLGSSVQFLFEQVAVGISGDLQSFAEDFQKFIDSGELAKLATNMSQLVMSTTKLATQLTPLITEAARVGRLATGDLSAAKDAKQAAGLQTGLGFAMNNSKLQQAIAMDRTKTGLASGAITGGAIKSDSPVRVSRTSKTGFGAFGAIGQKLGQNIFEAVNAKEKELRERKAASAFGGFQFDSSAFDVQENRVRQRIAEQQGMLKEQQADSGAVGSLAGADSMAAFKAMFGTGRDKQVVDKLLDIQRELQTLNSELLQIQTERGRQEQERMAREFSNL